MTDDLTVETEDFEDYSPATELVEDEAERLAEASSPESSLPTSDDDDEDEDGESPALGGAEALAGDLPSRLAARMGGEHAAWAFAGSGAAQAAAAEGNEFCRRFCPITHRCAGNDCRVHRYIEAAVASAGYDAAQEVELVTTGEYGA